MLGFQPTGAYLETAALLSETEHQEAPGSLYRLRDEAREENQNEVLNQVAFSQRIMAQNKRTRGERPEAGDLVLVRLHKVDAHLGMKLSPKWSEPKLLVSVSANGTSGHVRKVYGDGSTKRYHMDDLRQYVPRPPDVSPLEQVGTVVTDRKAMKYAGDPGQRAFFLEQPI
jgi:hypothetical protein